MFVLPSWGDQTQGKWSTLVTPWVHVLKVLQRPSGSKSALWGSVGWVPRAGSSLSDLERNRVWASTKPGPSRCTCFASLAFEDLTWHSLLQAGAGQTLGRLVSLEFVCTPNLTAHKDITRPLTIKGGIESPVWEEERERPMRHDTPAILLLEQQTERSACPHQKTKSPRPRPGGDGREASFERSSST